jgi:hypothetical protein
MSAQKGLFRTLDDPRPPTDTAIVVFQGILGRSEKAVAGFIDNAGGPLLGAHFQPSAR